MDRRSQIHIGHPVSIGDAINRSLELVEKDQCLPYGIPAGYPSLDRITRGWEPGELVVIGARPCVGKTAFALGMARNAAVEFELPTAYCSLETSVIELTERLIVSETGISIERLHGKLRMEDDDWQRVESSLVRLAKAPLYLDDSVSQSPGEYRISGFRNQAGMLVNEHQVKLFFVDYLQAACPDWGRYAPECLNHECRKNLRFLKETASFFGVPVIVLTCIERPENWHGQPPSLLDLGDYCPCAEEYADKIILLDRPSFTSAVLTDNETEPLLVRVVQNRNGRTGQAELIFDRERICVSEPLETDLLNS